MRLTSFTDYGLRSLMRMAAEPARTFSTAELADEFGLSRHHVTKIMQRLARAGIVATRRAEGCLIDHGANYLKAPTPALQALVAELPGAVDIAPPIWSFDGDGRVAPGDPAQNAEAKWTWPGGLNALDAGRLSRARELESVGFLQLTLAVQEKVGWNAGVALVA